MLQWMTATAIALVTLAGMPAQRATAPPGPSVKIETLKGTFTIQFYRADAPKSVDHIVALIKRNFYRGQRFHRVEASLVQFGDPTSRDMSQRDWWGRGGSGEPIGVAEISARKHVRGTVALANTGNAKASDSQLYICKVPRAADDGKYTVVGAVTSGMEVVDRLQVADVLRQVTLVDSSQ